MSTTGIGGRIRAERERRGISQVDLATRAKVAQTTVSKVERGLFDHDPGTASVQALVRVLDLDALPPPTTATPAPTVPTQDPELAAERVIGEVVAPGRDLPRDASAVAHEVYDVLNLAGDDPATLARAARVWLDAAAELRAAGVKITARSLLVQSTLRLLRQK